MPAVIAILLIVLRRFLVPRCVFIVTSGWSKPSKRINSIYDASVDSFESMEYSLKRVDT